MKSILLLIIFFIHSFAFASSLQHRKVMDGTTAICKSLDDANKNNPTAYNSKIISHKHSLDVMEIEIELSSYICKKLGSEFGFVKLGFYEAYTNRINLMSIIPKEVSIRVFRDGENELLDVKALDNSRSKLNTQRVKIYVNYSDWLTTKELQNKDNNISQRIPLDFFLFQKYKFLNKETGATYKDYTSYGAYRVHFKL